MKHACKTCKEKFKKDSNIVMMDRKLFHKECLEGEGIFTKSNSEPSFTINDFGTDMTLEDVLSVTKNVQ